MKHQFPVYSSASPEQKTQARFTGAPSAMCPTGTDIQLSTREIHPGRGCIRARSCLLTLQPFFRLHSFRERKRPATITGRGIVLRLIVCTDFGLEAAAGVAIGAGIASAAAIPARWKWGKTR
jgi:hypothetical protein